MASLTSGAPSLRAVVTGGTGAVGQHVVAQLLQAQAPAWTVVTVGRRPVTLRPEYGLDQAALESSGRLVQHSVDMEALAAPATAPLFAGANASFCCLGTTRRDAGSAAAFVHVDHDYVMDIARASHAGGVPVFSYVSSQGANANSWFLYMQTKGRVEAGIASLGFPHTAIMRPGMLDRGDKLRAVERAVLAVIGGMPVRNVAAAMIADAQAALAALGTSSGGGGAATAATTAATAPAAAAPALKFYYDKDINAMVKR
jgi:oxidoreductase